MSNIKTLSQRLICLFRQPRRVWAGRIEASPLRLSLIEASPLRLSLIEASPLRLSLIEASLWRKNQILNLKTTFISVGFLIFSCLLNFGISDICNASENTKKITLADDELAFESVASRANTVKEFLGEQKIKTGDNDLIFPSMGAKIFSGSKIIIERAKNITITADGKMTKSEVFGRNVASALFQNKISLGDDDIAEPAVNFPVKDGDRIEVIRVEIREELVKKDIPYETKTSEDDKLGWRIKKVAQKGEQGIEEIKYKVVTHNSREISRKIIDENNIKEPITEIITQGTYVKVGKSYSGAASWYSYTGTLSAASPWLPIGSYAKVTNRENGKSVIVKINDRGPSGEGRIIDLDKVAFAKIANLGEGVIEVKVEQVLN